MMTSPLGLSRVSEMVHRLERQLLIAFLRDVPTRDIESSLKQCQASDAESVR
jgi:hypothetical protein